MLALSFALARLLVPSTRQCCKFYTRINVKYYRTRTRNCTVSESSMNILSTCLACTSCGGDRPTTLDFPWKSHIFQVYFVMRLSNNLKISRIDKILLEKILNITSCDDQSRIDHIQSEILKYALYL